MYHLLKRRFLAVLFFITFLSTLSGQDTASSSNDSTIVYYFRNNFETQGPGYLTKVDTGITNIENYDPLSNPGLFFGNLGNVGLAGYNMVFEPRFKTGFDYDGKSAFEHYMLRNDSINYYWVKKPYTHLGYVMGAKKEQNLMMNHSQNVSSWLNLGLYFRYTSSPGYYTNQKSDDKNFAITSRFQTKDYRYIILANYLHNKIQAEENGGIKYDTVFDQNIEENRRNIEVNLNTAKNTLRENSYFLKQLFLLQKRDRFIINDSTDQPKSGKISPGNISLSSLYSRSVQLYTQDLSDNEGFYRTTFDSINPTYDSVFYGTIENTLLWTNSDNAKNQLLTFNFSVKHTYSELKSDSSKSVIKQIIPAGEVDFTISDFLKLNFLADYSTGNLYTGDYRLSGRLHVHTKFGDIAYRITNALQEADRFMLNYHSNHFRWQNQFRKTSYINNAITYQYKTLDAGVNFYNIGSYIYFDSLAVPTQLSDNLSVFAAFVHKLTHAGDFSLDVRGVFQEASNNAVRIPQVSATASLYYTKDLFKKATILQTGFDIFYNTSYFGYAYMPAIRSFYLQNHKETGDYFYGDVFINLQIKRARLFLKYVNLAYLLGEYNYYTVPSYPMQDGGFRFGVNWMFYD